MYIHTCIHTYTYTYVYVNIMCMCYITYEEFTRLAETRLAQNTLNYINIAYVVMIHVRVLLSFQQPTFQTITTHQRIFSCTCSDFVCFK